MWDYEAELVVVIGKKGKDISKTRCVGLRSGRMYRSRHLRQASSICRQLQRSSI